MTSDSRPSSGRPTASATATTVKKAGVGIRPRSILRSVSGEILAAAATSTMLRSPRAARSASPSRSPRSRSELVRGTRTMARILRAGGSDGNPNRARSVPCPESAGGSDYRAKPDPEEETDEVHAQGSGLAVISACKAPSRTMDEPELKIIDVFICKLRKKLQAATGGQHYIETVWGRGYVLRDPAD